MPEKLRISCPKDSFSRNFFLLTSTFPHRRHKQIYKSWYGAFFGQEVFDLLWFLIGHTTKIYIDQMRDIFSGKESSIFQARRTGPVLLACKTEDSLPEKYFFPKILGGKCPSPLTPVSYAYGARYYCPRTHQYLSITNT